ncbi:hypothetical protein Ancab_010701 [Ancistrocladus abbreviatus]
MDHHQEMASSQTLDSMLQVCSKPQQEKKPRPPEQSLKCPRCESTNTKFCYYNNYSLSQPRYFCKSCRRYWTKGGTLRNVPVGGGCRKNSKRSSSSSSSSSSSGKRSTHDHHQPLITTATTSNNNHHLLLPSQLLPLPYDPSSSNDLTLAFARLQKQAVVGGSEFHDHHGIPILGNHHPNNAHFDNILESQTFGVLNSMRGNFFDSGFDNGGDFYYEENDHGREEMSVMGYEDMMTSAATTPTSSSVTAAATTMKQEVCENGGRSEGEDQSRAFWGFPWQINGGGNMNGGGDLDSVRESCWNLNGFVNASWHGLLNSPLM